MRRFRDQTREAKRAIINWLIEQGPTGRRDLKTWISRELEIQNPGPLVDEMISEGGIKSGRRLIAVPPSEQRKVYWECGECSVPVLTNSRRTHAKGVHKREIEEIPWLCLEDVNIDVCEYCTIPYVVTCGGRDDHIHSRMEWNSRIRRFLRETAEGMYWVDWSDVANPQIKLYDERGQGEPKTILEAREEILYAAREALRHWHKVARLAMNDPIEEIEAR